LKVEAMGTEYFGSIDIHGNKQVAEILTEARNRLITASGKTSHFQIDAIKEVFFGSLDADTTGSIGCGGFQIDEIRLTESQPCCYMFFSTYHGYPDYFAQYLINQLKDIDPKCKIKLDCEGDDGSKVREWFSPRSR
jgi:hypothetical protein